MNLLPEPYRSALRAAAMAHHAAQAEGRAEPDPVPIVKFFSPVGAATWLATELDEDGDTLFGLADLGFGSPELGSFSLVELASVRLPYHLTIERDLDFTSNQPMSRWEETARRLGSIIAAEAAFRTPDNSELPTVPPEDGG